MSMHFAFDYLDSLHTSSYHLIQHVYEGPMIRTQVQLTEEQTQALKEMAHREQTSMAELIRQAIDRWLETAGPISPAERFERLP